MTFRPMLAAALALGTATAVGAATSDASDKVATGTPEAAATEGAATAKTETTTPGTTSGAASATTGTETAGDFSDQELETFVDAAFKVTEVKRDFSPRLEAAEDDAAREALVAEAREAMMQAVKDTDGIDLETYNAIGQAAQSDEALNQRITALVRDRMPGEAEKSGS